MTPTTPGRGRSKPDYSRGQPPISRLSRGPTGDNRPDPAVIPGDTLKKSSIPNSNSTIIKVNHDQANNKASSTNRSRTTSSSSSNNNSSRHRTRAQEYATEQTQQQSS